MDMACCNSVSRVMRSSDDRITRETLSYNKPCPSSPSSTIYGSISANVIQFTLGTDLANEMLYSGVLPNCITKNVQKQPSCIHHVSSNIINVCYSWNHISYLALLAI